MVYYNAGEVVEGVKVKKEGKEEVKDKTKGETR